MLEKHGIACDLMHGFNWDKWTTGKPAERLALVPAGQEHILEQEDGKKRWVQVVTELSRAFARKEINEALVSKLPDRLTQDQKIKRVQNLLQKLRGMGKIENKGSRASPHWVISQGN